MEDFGECLRNCALLENKPVHWQLTAGNRQLTASYLRLREPKKSSTDLCRLREDFKL